MNIVTVPPSMSSASTCDNSMEIAESFSYSVRPLYILQDKMHRLSKVLGEHKNLNVGEISLCTTLSVHLHLMMLCDTNFGRLIFHCRSSMKSL